MLKLFGKKSESLTVGVIRKQLKDFFRLLPPYKFRLLNGNGNSLRADNTRLKMPQLSNVTWLGLKTVADLNHKIESKFRGFEEGVTVCIRDARTGKDIHGNTSLDTVTAAD